MGWARGVTGGGPQEVHKRALKAAVIDKRGWGVAGFGDISLLQRALGLVCGAQSAACRQVERRGEERRGSGGVLPRTSLRKN